MRKLQGFWPLIVVALIGVLLVILAEPISKWVAASRAVHNGEIIGKIILAEGSVRKIHGADIELIASPVTQQLDLRDGDRIQTSLESRAAVLLNSQDEIEIGHGSAVDFQLWNPHDVNSPIYITQALGQIISRKTGVRGKAYVVHEGRLYFPGQKPLEKPMALTVLRNAPLDMHLAEANHATPGPEFEPDNSPEEPAPAVAPNIEPDTLSNEYIDETILAHQGQLQKCWLLRLKDEPALKGQIIVQFEISKRGKVKEMHIADSTLSDEVLQKCVMSVIERIQFREFKGAEISLSYPINFE